MNKQSIIYKYNIIISWFITETHVVEYLLVPYYLWFHTVYPWAAHHCPDSFGQPLQWPSPERSYGPWPDFDRQSHVGFFITIRIVQQYCGIHRVLKALDAVTAFTGELAIGGRVLHKQWIDTGKGFVFRYECIATVCLINVDLTLRSHVEE